MGDPMMHGRDLHKLGRELAEELDATSDPHAVTRARARLFGESSSRATRASGRGWAYAGLGLAGAAAVATLMFLGGEKGPPPAPAKPDALAQLLDGIPVTAPEGKKVPLAVDDGSRFEIASGSTVHMEPTRAGGSPWITIDRGTLRGEVATPSRWRVRTGPVDLRFSPGCDFEVSWDPDDRVVVVHVRDGRAELEGAVARLVESGERLRADLDGGDVVITPAPPRDPAPATSR
jgi:ferric-dicitrate binding protein FerR (iron transport regulator)